MELLSGFVFAGELGVHIAEEQAEDGVLRIFGDERLEEVCGARVLAVVVAQVDGEVEARFDGRHASGGDGALELADAFRFVPARDAHEPAQHPGDAGERVYIIVVEADAHVGVGEVGVERDGAQHVLAPAHAGARDGQPLPTQRVQPCLERVADAGVEVQLGRFFFFEARIGQRNRFVGQGEVGCVIGLLGTAPRADEAVTRLQRRAVDLPPHRFAFEQKAERVVGIGSLQLAEQRDRGVG